MLSIAAIQLIATSHAGATGEQVATTVYVNQHFEVRDHDQPVKYIFNGASRVARVTGSLSTNARIQRLRLHPGWNLCGVAVNQAALPVTPEILAVLRWNPVTRDYATVSAGQSLNAGSVVWIKAATNVVTSLAGEYREPEATAITADGSYVSPAGLEAWPVQLPAGVTVWRFDAANRQWHASLPGDLASISELPPKLAPGEAVYVHTSAPVELATSDPALGIIYYHQDHLGSSSAATDASGALIEESAYYPFGVPRHEHRLRPVEAHYRFTQKERDRESGLHDFGHRFYHGAVARWLSPDPMAESGGNLNPYSYVGQNPLKHFDPDGAEIKIARTIDRKTGTTTYQITLKAVFIDSSSKKFSQQQMAQFTQRLQSSIEKSFTGQDGKVRWSAKVDLRVVDNWKKVGRDDHVFRIVDKLGAAGQTTRGGMLMSIRTSQYTQKTPDEVDRSNPANKHYTWENFTSGEGTATHEFGHAAGLPHDNSHPNLMQEGSVRKHDNKTIRRQEIEMIWKASEVKSLNNREPVLDQLTRGNP